MSSDPPRRRFAPQPIETTYKSHRTTPLPPAGHRVGPNPELTPEASPRSLSPASACPRTRRRFAPQLIETSRRSHRVGDLGPATRPTDKTDITPYTNHIYTAKTKSKKRHDGVPVEEETARRKQPTRRESEEEGVQEYLLELAAKEVERQIQEDALAAFPNSRAREGGVAHFYFRDGSSSEDSPAMSPAEDDRGMRRPRRKTSSVDLNWWQRHMQEHAEKLAHDREDVEEAEKGLDDLDMTSDSELDKMDLTVPPDAMWTTSRRASMGDRQDSASEQTEARKWATAKESEALHVLRGPAPESTTPDRSQPSAQHHPQQQQQLQKQHAPLPQQQPPPPQQQQQKSPANDTGIRPQHDPFGRPFAALGIRPTAQLQRIRKFVSPPMLGKELNFRTCPSPKQTKLETDHSFVLSQNAKHENRDLSGENGLWRGYCCRSESTGGYLVPAELHPPAMMATPRTPGTPKELFAHEVDCVLAVSDEGVSDEPSSLWDVAGADSPGTVSGVIPGTAEHRLRSGAPKGLHMLHGLDERLQQEKVRAERNEKIALEFGDDFVTQVYNYLSLGYPAMARSFDDELSKISRVSVEELCRDDDKQIAKGHMLEMNLDETPEEERCPRWKALRVYIVEWARQHPDLDNLNPLAWGVHERRGSWAI